MEPRWTSGVPGGSDPGGGGVGGEGGYENYPGYPPKTPYPYSPHAPDYRFILQTPEGQKLVRECQSNSFWYRGLPLGCVAMLAEKYATQVGKIAASKFPLSRTIGVGLLGLIMGRISYVSTCRRHIEELWNSPRFEEYRAQQPQVLITQKDRSSSELRGADHSADLDRDVDTSANVQHKGLDDSFRPTLDNSYSAAKQDELSDTRKNYTSYEQLRRENRENYDQKLREQQLKHHQQPSRTSPPQQPFVPIGDRRESSSAHQPPSNYSYTPTERPRD